MYSQAINILSNQFMFSCLLLVFKECTVLLVCMNPVSTHGAFVNYAFIVIIIVSSLIINRKRKGFPCAGEAALLHGSLWKEQTCAQQSLLCFSD